MAALLALPDFLDLSCWSWRACMTRSRMVAASMPITCLADIRQLHGELAAKSIPVSVTADEGVPEISRRDRQMAALERCLEKLPTTRRQLVLGCYAPGASIREIAARSGQSEDGLYQLLRRIRLKLQHCVETTLSQEALL